MRVGGREGRRETNLLEDTLRSSFGVDGEGGAELAHEGGFGAEVRDLGSCKGEG